MASRQSGWGSVIKKRRSENFVGRGDQMRAFEENYVDDTPRYLLYSVVGQGGVGKSTLLLQFTETATNPSINAIVITCDDRYLSPAAAMGRIALQLAAAGFSDREFDERHKKYLELRQEVEADAKAPRGALDLVIHGMTGFALDATKQVPGVGVIAGYVDKEAAGKALSEGVQYLVSRWGNKDEVTLLREPERILTPLFLRLIDKVAEKRRVVLMFDVFERTGEALEPWLITLFKVEFGDIPLGVTFVISGRDPLDQRWTEFGSVIAYLHLEPFTLDETRKYLANRDVIDNSLVERIHKDTAGLPVLIELLAATKPKPGFPLADISSDAVERFLQWIPEADRREVALVAAVPRQFNKDVLSAMLQRDAAELFAWLSAQSFTRRDDARGWYYHEKVRELMLRYKQRSSPSDVAAVHAQLAEYFKSVQASMGLAELEAYASQTWRKYELEREYHALSAAPDSNSVSVLNSALAAFRFRWRFAGEVGAVLVQAADELGQGQLRDVVSAVQAFVLAFDKNDLGALCAHADDLLKQNALSAEAHATVLAGRGATYRLMGKYAEAVVDFDRAIGLDDESAWAIASRGQTYRLMGKYAEALVDFDRAISLDDKSAWAIGSRGQTYRQMGKYAEALVDFDRAIGLDDKSAWAIGSRGQTYLHMGKYAEALVDLDRAIGLDDKSAWAIASRGETYRLMGKYAEALVDLDRAVELNPNYAWAYARKALIHSGSKDSDAMQKAIASVHAIPLEDGSDYYAVAVVVVFESKIDECLAMLAEAIRLAPSVRYVAHQDDAFASIRDLDAFKRLLRE